MRFLLRLLILSFFVVIVHSTEDMNALKSAESGFPQEISDLT